MHPSTHLCIAAHQGPGREWFLSYFAWWDPVLHPHINPSFQPNSLLHSPPSSLPECPAPPGKQLTPTKQKQGNVEKDIYLTWNHKQMILVYMTLPPHLNQRDQLSLWCLCRLCLIQSQIEMNGGVCLFSHLVKLGLNKAQTDDSLMRHTVIKVQKIITRQQYYKNIRRNPPLYL